jgi:hypothetical protein
MTNERRQVLEMLAEGKVSAEEAERLLEKLDQVGESFNGSANDTPKEGFQKRMPKYLRVLVNSTDGDAVNIRVPLALVRTGIKLSTMMPNQANEALSDQGIDLSKLSELEGEELIQAIRELTVDVNSGDGDTVRVFCE